MADAKHALELLECGVGVFLYVCMEFLWVEFAPVPPAGFRRKHSFLGCRQIPVDGAPSDLEAARGLGFGTSGVNEFYHTLT